MAFPSSDAVLNSTADQDTSDPAADDGMNDAFGADLLQNLALRGLGTKEAAAAQPQHTSMRVQARALYRKSAIYQARNLSTNICIISAPVLFCILLLLLTAGVQQLMMGEEFKVCSAGDSRPSTCSSMQSSLKLHPVALACTNCESPHLATATWQLGHSRRQTFLVSCCLACSVVASVQSAVTRATRKTAPSCKPLHAHTPAWSAAAATVVCSSLWELKQHSVTSRTHPHGQQLCR
jgi:hypothetical protein